MTVDWRRAYEELTSSFFAVQVVLSLAKRSADEDNLDYLRCADIKGVSERLNEAMNQSDVMKFYESEFGTRPEGGDHD